LILSSLSNNGYHIFFPIALSFNIARSFFMFSDLPMPFMVGAVKLWPVHSRPEFSWFLAYEGKPFYFRSKQEAVLFARSVQKDKDFGSLPE
jgi:hypothetical protein